jgi:hypothetical protein
VKRLLLNCDQVFDVLTRGPFPTGQPEDEAVEQHLRACHECRRLAEALRPAVAVMHEAVAADQAIDLPEYQGSLPPTGPARRRLSIARLARTTASTPATARLASSRRGQPRQPQTISAARLIAASLLIAALGLLLGGMFSSRGLQRLTLLPEKLLPAPAAANVADPAPDATGLLTLASLNLPVTCVSLGHRPISADHAAEIAAAIASGSLEGLLCCTECHRAGLSQPKKATQLVAAVQQNCQACHRG